MVKDIRWEHFFIHNHRYADIINGIGGRGRQLVRETDLADDDTKSGAKSRDALRKVAFGTNFAIIGIENQEELDYSLPLRTMAYDLNRYEKQAARIHRQVRSKTAGLKPGEFLYGFKKGSRLYPEVTFILYSGEDPWDGAESLHEILNFENIPGEIREIVSDYRINVVDIRRLEDTSVFKTDVKQVFDFLRACGDRLKLTKLLETDEAFQNLEEDTVELLTKYADSKHLKKLLENGKYKKERKMNMCKGLRDLEAECRAEGLEAGRAEGLEVGRVEGLLLAARKLLEEGTLGIEKIADVCQLSRSEVEKLSQEVLVRKDTAKINKM